MNSSDYLDVIRKRWRAIAIFLCLGIAGAVAITLTTTARYQASTRLFVSAKDSATDLSNLAQGGQFTQQRVQSYAEIINSPEVTRAAAAQLNDGVSAQRIANETSASAPPNTVLLDVSVTDTSAARAQAIADAVSDNFAAFVNTLETPSGSTKSPVKVTVVKRADLPTSPSTPRKRLNLALGLLAGLVLGMVVAVGREALDTTVKDPERIDAELGLAPLGSIAYDRQARKRPLTVQADPHSPRVEAFRALRTNLQFIDIDDPPRSFVVTSSIPNEGKTTTAINLAITLGQSGRKVLLVEGDLRRPKIATYLGLEGAVGLTSVLVGSVGLPAAIQTWGQEDQIQVLTSGVSPPNPSELLGSQGMADLILELEAKYDVVVVDAPPLLPATDAAVVSAVVSGVLMVVRHGHVKREQLSRAVQSLRAVDARIYGAILTMTPSGESEYGYYGYRDPSGKKHRRHKNAPVMSPALRAPRDDAGPTASTRPEPQFLSTGNVEAVSPTVRTLTSGSASEHEQVDSEADRDPLQFFLG